MASLHGLLSGALFVIRAKSRRMLRRQGIQQGKQLGAADRRLRQIERRFGPPNDLVRKRITKADPRQADAMVRADAGRAELVRPVGLMTWSLPCNGSLIEMSALTLRLQPRNRS